MNQRGKILPFTGGAASTVSAKMRSVDWQRWSMPALVAGVAVCVLLAVFAVRLLDRSSRWQGEIARLDRPAPESPPPAPRSETRAPGPVVPAENHPGDAARKLEGLLNAAGITSYRYSVLAPETDEEDGGPARSARAFSERDAAAGDGEALPAEAFIEDAALPEITAAEGLLEWRIPLRAVARYGEIRTFLASLEESGSIWMIPRMELTRSGRHVAADVLLLTWTQPRLSAGPAGDHPSSPAQTASTAAAEVGRDPFHIHQVEDRGPHVPAPPELAAVHWGRHSAVLLGGRNAVVGETVGSWTVARIEPDGVLLRHPSGVTRRLTVPADVLSR
ncbi:MAG: hypothetical protein GF355_04795 [Candidatus Eisenbacteria bacterium]|nr:hypothetical protein [Candidatus Eisenbacteria bacterium]